MCDENDNKNNNKSFIVTIAKNIISRIFIFIIIVYTVKNTTTYDLRYEGGGGKW